VTVHLPVNVLQIVAIGGPLLIAIVSFFDIFCIWKESYTPGQVVQWWTYDHPWLAAFFAAFVGAFAAHIFWHT